MAINSGFDITVNAADIVLMKNSLYDVVNAILISRKSFRRIKINFIWAFVYNVILIPIAMGVLYPVNHFKLDPMFAGGAMAFSSISVVLSSLLLKLFKPITDISQSSAEQVYIRDRKNSLSNSDGTTQYSEFFNHNKDEVV